jgi:hypothetical protein
VNSIFEKLISPELEAILAECDESQVMLYPDGAGSVDVVPTLAGQPVTRFVQLLRPWKADLLKLFNHQPTIRRIEPATLIPFIARNLECRWLRNRDAPAILFEDDGRTFWRYSPRTYHWFTTAVQRGMIGLRKRDERYRLLYRRQFNATAGDWIHTHFRRDQVERAAKHAHILPTLPVGQPAPQARDLRIISLSSRNRRHGGEVLPIWFPKRLPFDLADSSTL